MIQPLRSFRVDRLSVEVHASKVALGEAAAGRAVSIVRQAIADRGRARLIIGTGPSQNEVIVSLTRARGLAWSRIEVFHMDEYIGLAATHPASFRRWLQEHVVDTAHPAVVHYLIGDAPNLAAEQAAYTAALIAAPIDVCFLGFGENGHIAFNDPHVADFADPHWVKIVEMDERCRRQQVGEGHFADLAAVPPRALTLTCRALLEARHLICSVPDRRKAEAVRNALEGPVTAACPASGVRNHPAAWLYLEPDSASLLTGVHSQRRLS